VNKSVIVIGALIALVSADVNARGFGSRSFSSRSYTTSKPHRSSSTVSPTTIFLLGVGASNAAHAAKHTDCEKEPEHKDCKKLVKE
jgi:hypothetical protein